jgi:hypothetical protein
MPRSRRARGIWGHPNISGNDGTITRSGSKAPNKSLSILSGEAYKVEIGVTNEGFPDERGNAPIACLYNHTPEDATNFNAVGEAIPSDVVAFSDFMRFLATPAPFDTGDAWKRRCPALATGKRARFVAFKWERSRNSGQSQMGDFRTDVSSGGSGPKLEPYVRECGMQDVPRNG